MIVLHIPMWHLLNSTYSSLIINQTQHVQLNILPFNEKFSTKFSIDVLLIQTKQLVFLIGSNIAFVKSELLYIFLLV